MKSSPVAALVLAASMLIGHTAFAQAKSDKEFLTDAIQGDMAEIQAGKLAETKGNAKGVTTYGAMLAMDHAHAEKEAKKIAASLGVALPAAPKPDAKQEYDKLSKLKGSAFDAEFLRAMIEAHQMTIAEFQAEAKSGGGAAGKMASAQLPTLEKHLAEAQSLQKQATAP